MVEGHHHHREPGADGRVRDRDRRHDHILEEAQEFWGSGTEGARQWGPCAEVETDGGEFHYLVKALRVNTRLYLVFQLDEGAERIREVLQKVRADALAAAQNPEKP